MTDPMELEKRAQEEAKRKPGAIQIRRCARCGGDHELVFDMLKGDPIEAVEGDYTHWAMCPETNQPIMMAKNARVLDEGLLDLFKEVARGDLEVEKLMTKVMKRRVKSAEIPEEIGDLDNPLKVVGYESMGSRMAFIFRTDRDSLKIYVDTKTFNDVLVQSVANGSEDMAELIEQFANSAEDKPLEAPKSFRRMLHELGEKMVRVEGAIMNIRDPLQIGTTEEPTKVKDYVDCDKTILLELSRKEGDLILLTLDRETFGKFVSIP